MPERLRIEADLGKLPEPDWQRLVVGHPALRIEMLKALVATAGGALPLHIFLLEDEAGIAAAAICEPVAAHGAPSLLDSLLYGRAARVASKLGASTRLTLLFAKLLGTESAVVLRQANPTEQRRLFGRLLEGIEEYAAQQNVGIAFIGVSADNEPLRTALRDRGYLDTEIQPTTRLKVEWTDFDGYVKHIQRLSKNAAQTVRRERNRNRASGVRIRQLPYSDADARALDTITRAHHRHKNGRDPFYGPQFLPELSKALGDDFLVFEAVRDGQRVAMLAVVRSGSVGWVSWFGVELLDRPNDFTYANLVFYHLADTAATLGLKTLLYGGQALDAKRRRGCQIITSHLYYQPRRRISRFLATPYFSIHRAWYRRKLR